MDKSAQIREVVFRAVDAMNAELPDDGQVSRNPDAVLYGEEGVLDSLGLVDLAMHLQEGIIDQFDVALMVANDDALASAESPFRTIETLTVYIGELLEKEQSD